MDQRALVALEKEKGDNKYVFLMPVGVPYGEAYDAAFGVLEEIKKMSAEALERVRRQEEKEEGTAKKDAGNDSSE